MMACASDDVSQDIVDLLITHKNCNINATETTGTTALMMAATNGRTEIVNTLLAHKNCNIDADRIGETALMIAKRLHQDKVVAVFENHQRRKRNWENRMNLMKVLTENKYLPLPASAAAVQAPPYEGVLGDLFLVQRIMSFI